MNIVNNARIINTLTLYNMMVELESDMKSYIKRLVFTFSSVWNLHRFTTLIVYLATWQQE